MSQYIGLNDYALAWVKNAIRTEKYSMTAWGCDRFDLEGAIYYLPPEGHSSIIATEVLQASKGPILCHLKIELYMEQHLGEAMGKWPAQTIPAGIVDMGYYFSWMVDPSVIGFDRASGRYFQ